MSICDETRNSDVHVPKIKVVTVATHEFGYMKWLKESCLRHNANLTILGQGLEWKGYSMRYDLMQTFLEEQDDRDVICFIDAYDVILHKNTERLYDEFRNTCEEKNCKIICGFFDENAYSGILSPINLISNKWCEVLFNIEANSHINGGTYIGYVKELKEMIKLLVEYKNKNSENDDEYIINTIYKEGKIKIYIDFESNFFKNINPMDIIDRSDYNCHAYFIHRIGNLPLFSYLQANGYVITNKEKAKILSELTDVSINKIKYHTSNFFKRLIQK